MALLILAWLAQTLRKETVVENMEIAEDEVKVTVEGAFDIAGVVEAHSSR